MSIKTIFWDNDGVLVDTERLYFLATQKTLKAAGFDLSQEEFIRLFLVGNTGLDYLALRGLSPDQIQSMRDRRNTLYGEMLATEPFVMEGVHDVVRTLSQRFRMGIVTSSRRDHFTIMHARTGLLPYFEFVLANGDYPRSKPDAAPYLCALERSGCAPNECLVIEDSERGFTSAKAAGIRCIVIPGGLTRSGRFEGAHNVLGHVRELIAAIEAC